MGYFHGGDVYRNRVRYDFSVNINPMGMPPGCMEAAMKGVELSGCYPDWKGEALCRALACEEGIEEEQIILGNGAAELLYAMAMYLRPGRAVVPVPAFQEYEAAVIAAGGKCFYPTLKEEKLFRLEESFRDLSVREADMIFLCNPNNPTGAVLEREVLQRIAAQCEETGTWLCVDECFLPFSGREAELTMKRDLNGFPHLIVLRAFTKIYAMPGLRLGYAMTGGRALLHGIRGCIQPWNTSVPAQMAGLQALEDKGFIRRTVEMVTRERSFLYGGLCKLSHGVVDRVYPSEANFIFLHGREDLYERMLERGILIRDCGNFRGLEQGYFRIAVRTHEENQVILECLHQLNSGTYTHER